MKRTLRLMTLAAAMTAGPSVAGTICNFNLECYLTEPCAGSGWALTVDLAGGVLSSTAEDLQILHVEEGAATQVVARGEGSLNLLTIDPELSLFTAHIAGAPAAITYVGECSTE